MNTGTIRTTKSGKIAYVKQVDWNKAVLWKDREISINPAVVKKMFARVELVIFVDAEKRKCWSADFEKIKKNWKLKKVSQEEQWYFGIDLLEEKKLPKINIDKEIDKKIKELNKIEHDIADDVNEIINHQPEQEKLI